MKAVNKICLFLGCVSVALSSGAFGMVQIPFGWYLEGNVGTATVSGTDFGSGTKVTTSGASWGINAGYKFMPYLAGEVGYTRYGNGKLKMDDVTISTIKYRSADIAAKGILPIIDSGFELFAKLGFGWLQAKMSDDTHTANGLFIGAGGDYSITPNVPVIVQWARVNGDSRTGNIDFYSIGLAYLFG